MHVVRVTKTFPLVSLELSLSLLVSDNKHAIATVNWLPVLIVTDCPPSRNLTPPRRLMSPVIVCVRRGENHRMKKHNNP